MSESKTVMRVPRALYEEVKAICDAYRATQDIEAARGKLQALGLTIAVRWAGQPEEKKPA